MPVGRRSRSPLWMDRHKSLRIFTSASAHFGAPRISADRDRRLLRILAVPQPSSPSCDIISRNTVSVVPVPPSVYRSE